MLITFARLALAALVYVVYVKCMVTQNFKIAGTIQLRHIFPCVDM
jgi:hypothetical protein